MPKEGNKDDVDLGDVDLDKLDEREAPTSEPGTPTDNKDKDKFNDDDDEDRIAERSDAIEEGDNDIRAKRSRKLVAILR